MAQVMNLLSLAPTIQGAILTGKLAVSERPLRPVVRHVGWEKQEEALASNY